MVKGWLRNGAARRLGPAALFCPGLEPPGPAEGEEEREREQRLLGEAEGSGECGGAGESPQRVFPWHKPALIQSVK